MLVKVDKFIFLVDFVVLDIEKDREIPLILERPFLTIGKALIDVYEEKLTLRVEQEEITSNVLHSSKYLDTTDDYFRFDTVDECVKDDLHDCKTKFQSEPDCILMKLLIFSLSYCLKILPWLMTLN